MKSNKLKILIATGIYPPALGGPAEYAKNIEESWREIDHEVMIKTYTKVERTLPIFLRHIYFLFKSAYYFLKADFVLVLDTFSVALPIAVLSFIFRKPFIIRTGGDFLWESYVERTGKKVLFKNFYQIEQDPFSLKEKIIFKLTKWILDQAKVLVFSTDWQRQIWTQPYGLDLSKTKIVENFYGSKINNSDGTKQIFIGTTRPLVWKNTDILRRVFDRTEVAGLGFGLDMTVYKHDIFLHKIAESYAVILVSLGDISPNMILEAVRAGKPFICTRECGLYDKLKDIGLWVDPLNEEDIVEKVKWLTDPINYKTQQMKVREFSFTHTYKQIAEELLNLK